jgi:hypothetical protein
MVASKTVRTGGGGGLIIRDLKQSSLQRSPIGQLGTLGLLQQIKLQQLQQSNTVKREKQAVTSANVRMRELIISNFLRKYLTQVDEGFFTGKAYSRLTEALAAHIDEYLLKNQQRCVRDLEEQLRQLADAQRGATAATPQLFLRQQRQAQSTKHAKTDTMNKTTGPKAMRNNLMIDVPGLDEPLSSTMVMSRSSGRGPMSLGKLSQSQTPGEDPALATFLRLKMGMPIKHNNPLAATQFVGKRAHSTLLGDFGKDWGDITRYHQVRDELAIKQEKDLAEHKKQQVRSVLDSQLREQAA